MCVCVCMCECVFVRVSMCMSVPKRSPVCMHRRRWVCVCTCMCILSSGCECVLSRNNIISANLNDFLSCQCSFACFSLKHLTFIDTAGALPPHPRTGSSILCTDVYVKAYIYTCFYAFHTLIIDMTHTIELLT